MKTFISMLRGINVGGKKVLMTDLKALYEELKCKDVITYIQSGNVIFKAGNIADLEMAGKIEKKLRDKYKFDVPVIIRSVEEMEHILTNNPFLKQKNINIDKLHVTFLEMTPEKAQLDKLQPPANIPDQFIIKGKEIFLHCPNGYGITKLSNTFFENKLKIKATTRNWKTVNKLVELAGGG
jgi:uncharacterized protein (DUF1697 family)